LTGASAKLKRGHVKRYAVLGGLAVTILPGASRSFNRALPKPEGVHKLL